MKKHKIKLVIIILLIVTIITVIIIPTYSNADIIINPSDYDPTVHSDDGTELAKKANIIIGAVQTVGSIIAVISLLVIGIRYMLSSIEEKANFKEQMVPYVVGCILLIGIVNIVGIIYNLAFK